MKKVDKPDTSEYLRRVRTAILRAKLAVAPEEAAQHSLTKALEQIESALNMSPDVDRREPTGAAI